MKEKCGPRLLTARGETELLQTAEQWFGCPVSQLHRVDYESEQGEFAAVFCPEKIWGKYENMDAAFHLEYRPDGVFLELLPEQGTGTPLAQPKMMDYISRKNLKNFANESFKKLVNQRFGYGRIAPPQEERLLNEEVTVVVASNEMSASAVLLPGESGGSLMTMKDIEKALAEKKVVYGIDSAALERILRDRPYFEHVTVANGTAAVDGKDGSIQFHFKNRHSGTPKVDPETGMADFHTLDWITRVKKGELLVSRILATAGESGSTVCGRTLTPKHGKEFQMPRGVKVSFNQDKTEMYAAEDGHVESKNELVQVSNIYDIPGDVDMTIGDINFSGTVIVRGSVTSKMKIKATGEVTVCGGVQDADIEAGGDVTIVNGLQGKGIGKVITRGTLFAKFIEQGVVQAQNVVADEIINSRVDCGGDITVVGKHGFIAGGVIRALHMVAAQTVGTVRNPKTHIEVGTDPAALTKYKEVQKQIENTKKVLQELEKACNYLRPRSGTSNAVKIKLRQVVTTKVKYTQSMYTLKREFDGLQKKIEAVGNGMIRVLNIVYPGAVMIISGKSYPVTGTPIRNATFKISEGEVVFLPCMYSEEEGHRKSRRRI